MSEWVIGGIGSDGASGVIDEQSRELLFGDYFSIDGHIGALPTPGPTDGPVSTNERIIQQAIVTSPAVQAQAQAKARAQQGILRIPQISLPADRKKLLFVGGAIGLGILIGIAVAKRKK